MAIHKTKSSRKKTRKGFSGMKGDKKAALRAQKVPNKTYSAGQGPIASGNTPTTMSNPGRISKSYFEKAAGKRFSK